MKHLFIALMSTLGLFLADGQQNDLQRANLKGKIKSMKTTSYKAKEINGQIIKEKRQTSHPFESDYHMLERKNIHPNYAEELFGSVLENYNEMGNISSIIVHKYEITYQIDYHYNDENQPIKVEVYRTEDGTETLMNTAIYSYPEPNVVKMKLESEWEETRFFGYIYDNKRLKSYYDGKHKAYFVYQEDLLKEIIVQDNHYKGFIRAEYNEKKHISKMTTGDNQSKGQYINTFKYSYDQSGNWIQRINYENGRVISVTERIIEYY